MWGFDTVRKVRTDLLAARDSVASGISLTESSSRIDTVLSTLAEHRLRGHLGASSTGKDFMVRETVVSPNCRLDYCWGGYRCMEQDGLRRAM